MHIQTHTTYIAVAFGMKNSVGACTIWPRHNGAHLHVVWLLGGIVALFQLSLDKESFNCVFNEPEQETATKSFTGKGGLPSPQYCNVEKQSEEGGPKLRCSLNKVMSNSVAIFSLRSSCLSCQLLSLFCSCSLTHET